MLKDVKAIPSECVEALLVNEADKDEDFLKKWVMNGDRKIANNKTATTVQLVAR
jgi:hypothetical protein